jgi:phage major head subunit gpT-like protein
VQGEGSQWEFEYDEHLYGVDTWRNVAYGRWQRACLVTMT